LFEALLLTKTKMYFSKT